MLSSKLLPRVPYSRFPRAVVVPAGVLAIVLVALRANADIAPACCEFDNDVTCGPASVGIPCPSGGTCMQVQCGMQMLPSFVGPFLYKCLQCPTVIADPNGQCTSNSQIGQGCDDAGTCTLLPTYCRTAMHPYIACQVPADSGAVPGACSTTDGAAPDASPANDASSPLADSSLSDAASIDEASPLPTDAAMSGSGSGSGGPSATPDASVMQVGGSSGGCSCSATREAGTLAGLLVAGGLVALLLERRRSR